MGDFPFNLQGKTVTFTADTSAPTSVQCPSSSNVGTQQYVLTSAGSVLTFVGWGKSAGEAAANAVIPTSTPAASYPLLPGSQVSVTAPTGAYFTGITASGTAVIYVSPGEGE